MNNLFLVDSTIGISVKYHELFSDLSNIKSFNKYCKSDSYYTIFKNILTSIIIGEEIVLLDHDFSTNEIDKLLGKNDSLSEEKPIDFSDEINFKYIQEKIKVNNNSWKITLFTSITRKKYLNPLVAEAEVL